ncbi:hypothetical protein CYLTODRAFT_441689 [Cylindrobasidium torrendii FP15055 ss-10]|uniref:Uncharacterized protein n=1 Tax=Cylindrobasidium torrendii FP15055 ss-10 TaxID=1314674 RepID=A0A0D7BK35_9AGAR|nr:hypothetical protein CYLTODRAFT_441689 [Cylindrobasidium torrendii FP15055 ss-10]
MSITAQNVRIVRHEREMSQRIRDRDNEDDYRFNHTNSLRNSTLFLRPRTPPPTTPRNSFGGGLNPHLAALDESPGRSDAAYAKLFNDFINCSPERTTRRPSLDLGMLSSSRMKRRASSDLGDDDDEQVQHKRPCITRDTIDDVEVTIDGPSYEEDAPVPATNPSEFPSPAPSPTSTADPSSPGATYFPGTPGTPEDKDTRDPELCLTSAPNTSLDEVTAQDAVGSARKEAPNAPSSAGDAGAAVTTSSVSSTTAPAPPMSVQATAGPSTGAATRVSLPHPSVTTRPIIPVLASKPASNFHGPLITTSTAGGAVSHPHNLVNYQPAVNLQVPSHAPPPATVAPTTIAASIAPTTSAPVAAAPPVAQVALQSNASPSTAVVAPATAVNPTPSSLLLAAAPSETIYVLWEKLPNGNHFSLDYRIGLRIDQDLIYGYMESFRRASSTNILWGFTLQTVGGVVSVSFNHPPGGAPYLGAEVLTKYEYRKQMIQAHPYLAIRAIEQGKFDQVFHAKRGTPQSARTWVCPHCGGEIEKGQANKLAKHFTSCAALCFIEKQVVSANP